jgi:hypothetical protein
MSRKNFGILASIDWNSNNWQAAPTADDLSNSKFGYVVENGLTYTSLNFAHEIYPVDSNGYYYGLLPQLWSRMPDKEKSRYVEVVFIKSQNWVDKVNYIVGFYAFPQFEKCRKPSPLMEYTNEFELNVKALPKDIHIVKNMINLNTHPDRKEFLPAGKEMGKQGYNYLTKGNVFKILDALTKLNSDDKKLSGIKLRLLQSIENKKEVSLKK